MFSSDQQYSVDRLSTSTNKQHEFGLGSQLTNKNILSPPNVTVACKQYSFHIKDDATYATHKRKTNSAKNHAKTHSTTKTATERPSERFDPANATATTLTTNDDTDHCFDPANDLPNHTKTKHQTQTDKKTASSQRVLANQGCQKRGGTITLNRKARRNNHIQHAIERVC